MNVIGRTLLFVCVWGAAATAAAQNLSKVQRVIGKEPVYRSETVRYCLLVFGPQAKTKVWLVQDDSRLFVDRNGNGDLTESGEEIAPETGEEHSAIGHFFRCGDIAEGSRLHKSLHVGVIPLKDHASPDPRVAELLKQNPDAVGYAISLDVDLPAFRGNGLNGRVEHLVSLRDVNGFLEFGESPESAPVIHFGGPWKITLFDRPVLKVGHESDVYLAIGTPGLGAGTTAFVGYEKLVPPEAHPQVSLTLPNAGEAGEKTKKVYQLKERC